MYVIITDHILDRRPTRANVVGLYDERHNSLADMKKRCKTYLSLDKDVTTVGLWRVPVNRLHKRFTIKPAYWIHRDGRERHYD